MIEESITKTEAKDLFVKMSIGVLLGLLILGFFLALGLGIYVKETFDVWPFAAIKYLFLAIWFYYLCKLALKVLPLYIHLLRGEVKKITAEFSIVEKEIHKTATENFSDTLNYYLFVHSTLAKQDFRLKVDCNDYEEIQNSDTLTLTYFSHLNVLLIALYRNRKLEKLCILNKIKTNISKK